MGKRQHGIWTKGWSGRVNNKKDTIGQMYKKNTITKLVNIKKLLIATLLVTEKFGKIKTQQERSGTGETRHQSQIRNRIWSFCLQVDQRVYLNSSLDS